MHPAADEAFERQLAREWALWQLIQFTEQNLDCQALRDTRTMALEALKPGAYQSGASAVSKVAAGA